MSTLLLRLEVLDLGPSALGLGNGNQELTHVRHLASLDVNSTSRWSFGGLHLRVPFGFCVKRISYIVSQLGHVFANTRSDFQSCF